MMKKYYSLLWVVIGFLLIITTTTTNASTSWDDSANNIPSEQELTNDVQPPPKEQTAVTDSPAKIAAEVKQANVIIVIVCVCVGVIVIVIFIAIILCIIFRKRICGLFSRDTNQAPPGNIYYEPHHFNHKGPLKIKKQGPPVDLKAVYPDEKDDNPPNAHFQFTENQNEVYDIGSEVEQIID